jgi:hypothetical protein
MQQLTDGSLADQSNPVDAARVAIWRLFEEGYVDEDMATAGLLAVDLGTRRAAAGVMGRRDRSAPVLGSPVAR